MIFMRRRELNGSPREYALKKKWEKMKNAATSPTDDSDREERGLARLFFSESHRMN